jgi:hypothetical protein
MWRVREKIMEYYMKCDGASGSDPGVGDFSDPDPGVGYFSVPADSPDPDPTPDSQGAESEGFFGPSDPNPFGPTGPTGPTGPGSPASSDSDPGEGVTGEGAVGTSPLLAEENMNNIEPIEPGVKKEVTAKKKKRPTLLTQQEGLLTGHGIIKSLIGGK